MSTRKNKQATKAVEAPVVETPVVEVPEVVVEAPVVEEPVVEAPVVEAPVVEEPVKTPVAVEASAAPVYDSSTMAAAMGGTVLAERIAPRLANYATVLQTARDVNALMPLKNNMTDIINLFKRAERTDFVKAILGMTTIIGEDIAKFGAKSSFSGRTPFLPYMGYVGPETIMVEVLVRVSDKASRNQLLKVIDHKALTAFLTDEKKDLFIEAFK